LLFGASPSKWSLISLPSKFYRPPPPPPPREFFRLALFFFHGPRSFPRGSSFLFRAPVLPLTSQRAWLLFWTPQLTEDFFFLFLSHQSCTHLIFEPFFLLRTFIIDGLWRFLGIVSISFIIVPFFQFPISPPGTYLRVVHLPPRRDLPVPNSERQSNLPGFIRPALLSLHQHTKGPRKRLPRFPNPGLSAVFFLSPEPVHCICSSRVTSSFLFFLG